MAESNIQINALPQATLPLSLDDIFHCKQGIIDKHVKLTDILQPHASQTGNVHGMTKADINLGNVTNDAQLARAKNLSDVTNVGQARANLGIFSKDEVNSAIGSHANNRNNPHGTTKAQVNLGNVDNYSSTDKYTDGSVDKFAVAKAVNDLFKMIQGMYPVGHRIYTENPNNPATYLPVGRWQLTGQGRVSVGYDAANQSRPVGSRFGSSTISIGVDNIPSHNHSVSLSGGNHTHAGSASMSAAGEHAHSFKGNTSETDIGVYDINHMTGPIRLQGHHNGFELWTNGRQTEELVGRHSHYFSGNTDGAGSHTHNLSVGIGNSGNLTMSGTSGSTGSGRPFYIEQPSEIVYIWKRVA